MAGARDHRRDAEDAEDMKPKLFSAPSASLRFEDLVPL